MAYQEIFDNYFNQAITGFIGGLVAYIITSENLEILGIKLNKKWKRAIYGFLVAVILISVYSALIYFFGA